jgi:hypothetical protein
MVMKGLGFRAAQDPERFDALERAGFLVDRYGDLSYQLYHRRGGHYIDSGASAKIAAGLVCSSKQLILI